MDLTGFEVSVSDDTELDSFHTTSSFEHETDSAIFQKLCILDIICRLDF